MRRSDIGLWLGAATFGSTRAVPGSNVEVSVNRRIGYGVSFNHYLTPKISVALSAEQLRGEAALELHGTEEASIDAGPLRAREFAVVAQWHATPPWIFDLYIGAGPAYINGAKIELPARATAEHVAGTIPFGNKLTWLADAGASLPVREGVSLGVDVKWTYYTVRIHTTPDDPFQHLKLHPLSISLGLRFRMVHPYTFAL